MKNLDERQYSTSIEYKSLLSIVFSSETNIHKDLLFCTNSNTYSFLAGFDNQISLSLSSNPKDVITPLASVSNLIVQGMEGRLRR